ncbi:MAG: hypothetical protein QM570_04905 [Planctomycetota bacterium]|jgi:hypothetical protein|nr:hypothetical protein [Planctomycetota bacterium]
MQQVIPGQANTVQCDVVSKTTADPIVSGTAEAFLLCTAGDSGTAGCWALYKSDGTTKVADGTVAETSGGDINFDETAWLAGGTVSVGTLTLTIPPA